MSSYSYLAYSLSSILPSIILPSLVLISTFLTLSLTYSPQVNIISAVAFGQHQGSHPSQSFDLVLSYVIIPTYPGFVYASYFCVTSGEPELF